MSKFFRFPHTPHLTWLAKGQPRGDKILDPTEAEYLLENNVIIEEKLDGANIGISLTKDRFLQVQNRGSYLTPPYTGQFTRLAAWLAQHENEIINTLIPGQIAFGEWCAAKHSLDYTALPDWFLLFDIYESTENKFWSCIRRNELAKKTNLKTTPQLFSGKATTEELKTLITNKPSHYRKGPVEGVIIRRDSGNWCEMRAKLVRPDFSQSIEEHWKKRPLEWNRVKYE